MPLNDFIRETAELIYFQKYGERNILTLKQEKKKHKKKLSERVYAVGK